MTQIIAGQATDLTKTVFVLVKELLETNWPTSTFDPVKTDVRFGVDTWDDYGDIQLHVNDGPTVSRTYSVGGKYSQVSDSAVIRLFVRKNQEEVPANMGNAQRKIEEIIKGNTTGLGQGIPVVTFDGWDPVFEDMSLRDVWQVRGSVTAVYWKVNT